MANRSPEDPESFRKKARDYQTAAAVESDPERRRAYILIASEYDKLADAIETESDASATEGTQARPAAKERIEPKPR